MGSFFHQYCPEGTNSKYRLIVFDDEKQAFLPLTEYYHYQITRIGESSVIAYLHALEPFFYWLKHTSQYQGKLVQWNDEAGVVQVAVRDYLISKMGCKVRGRDGYEGIYLTSKSSKTVNLFLAAAKGFYKSMIHLKLYGHSNPLVDIHFEDRIGIQPGMKTGYQLLIFIREF